MLRGGWIKPVVLESGRWRFREEDVERLAGIVIPRKVILYARVSSSSQRGDLERQVKALKEWTRGSSISDYKVVTDVGSGLNEDREGFRKILKLATEKNIKDSHRIPDRLTRFGFKTLKELLGVFGIEVVVLNHEGKELREKLVEDLITIISHFASKLYGMGSYKYEEVIKGARKLVEDP